MSWPLRVLSIVLAVGAGLAWTLIDASRRPKPALSVLGRIPALHLVDERGVPFSVDSMAGHVTVVDFFFTRCGSSCPRLTARMAELQALLARDKSSARLLSISVDPDNDTPAVLTSYAHQANADLSRWSFVTGSVREVEHAVVDGFKVSLQRVARNAGDYDVVHGEWLVLVDPQARVRGYYSVRESSDLNALVKDVETLEEHPL